MALVPENIIVLWPGAHGAIPSGWARVTSYDGRFIKARTSGSAANAGATSHTHVAPSHTHAVPAHTHAGTTGLPGGGNALATGSATQTGGAYNHTHSYTSGSCAGGTSGATTPTFACTTIEPPHSGMIAIKSDGSPAGFPDDSVVYYNNASAPTGWTDHADSREKFIKAPAACGNGGTEAGGGTHVHAGAGHTHTAPSAHDHSQITISGSLSNGGTGSVCSECGRRGLTNHNHVTNFETAQTGTLGSTTSASTAAQTDVPPYHILLGIQNTSGADNWLEEAIVMVEGATGDVPDDWTICNGDDNASGNATPNLDGKYVLMAADGGSVGGTGGSVCHDHTDPAAHTHSQSHNHALTGSYPVWFYWAGAGGSPMNCNTTGNQGCHYHFGPAGGTGGQVTCSTTTASCGTAQTVNTTANTEPIHRTILYLSAPEEPAATGSAAMFGANL